MKLSAGILMYRNQEDGLEVLLVHPGGPFWAKKDLGSWSIPKGEYADGEDPLNVALREFEEELGTPPRGEFWELGEFRQPSSKRIRAWAVEGNLDVRQIVSNNFTIEWPPKSGTFREFPEVDRAEWFSPRVARDKLLKGQVPILMQLLSNINVQIVDEDKGGTDGPSDAQGSLF